MFYRKNVTDAMRSASDGKEIPRQQEHDPTLRDSGGWTVAMYFADNGKKIPTQWEHDPTI